MARRGNRYVRRRRRSSSRRRAARRDERVAVAQGPTPPTGPVDIPATVTVRELSDIVGATAVDTVKALMRLGVMATVNETVDFQTAAKAAHLLGVAVRRPADEEQSLAGERLLTETDRTGDEAAVVAPRPPIVTILGHVDHGKTTLLDALRGTQVTESEAGGITQSIGAYQVEWKGQAITFIDTPGHAAFTEMRARGAQVTDIVVLLIAADDGVMAQTDEAIAHARAAKVPIIVAINKIDMPGADVERVKRQLAERNLLVESWGGDIVSVEISALKKIGLEDLLESIVLVAEVEELTADPARPGLGVVIEAHMDRSRGPLATVVVRAGTVRTGDNVAAGLASGRIRDMIDGFGRRVEEAGPSTPIQVMGLNGLPEPGNPFDVVENEKMARQLVEARRRLAGEHAATRRPPTLAEVLRRVQSGDVQQLNLVIKTGSQGSIDAVRRAVEPLSTKEVQVNIVHNATGMVNETDVMLASASDAIILAFESGVQPGAVKQADAQGVEIRSYDVIYELVDDVRSAVSGMLAPELREIVLGRAVVLQTFGAGRRDTAAGFRVQEGQIVRNSTIRVLRAGKKLWEGRITSLRRFRDDVREVGTGFEGGMTLDGFNDFQEGDLLEAFAVQEFRRRA